MLCVRKVCKSYVLGGKEISVLKDVSFTAYAGEFVAFTGQSGSGKSTLMNILGCLDRADSGNYQLDGVELTGLSSAHLAAFRGRKIGFVFQGFQLVPDLTAAENIELPLLYGDLSGRRRRERVRELLAAVGMQERAGHLPAQLSGGQQQRIAVARALAVRPSLILADEPTGNLDPENGQVILRLLRQAQQSGCCVLLVTHDPVIAAAADRKLQLCCGKASEVSEG